MSTNEPNYTDEQVARIQEVAAENGGVITNETALELADEFGKNVRSVRAKAVRMDIYKAKPKQSVNGGPVENKSDIAKDIEDIVGRSMEGLDKAPKPQLKFIRDWMLENTDNDDGDIAEAA